ncbi:hypothetical protein M1563_01400 [Patescibacteria group bacterium]|nr:hypothetical protein [Patescibacteria group bacterium]
MDQRTRQIMVGALAVFIVVVIAAIIYYLTKTTLPGSSTQTAAVVTPPPFYVTPSPFANLGTTSNIASNGATLPSGSTNTTAPLQGTGSLAGTKIYNRDNFTIYYPETWGLLTCSNSKNIEFDPTSNQDLPQVVCNIAVKPITVLVSSQLSCSGTTTKIGGYTVVKSSVTKDDGITTNRWCVDLGVTKLDITDRVAATGARATATQDYSSQIEQLIQNIKVAGAS